MAYRNAGLLVTLTAALILAVVSSWATVAFAKPADKKPGSGDDLTEIQLLAVNDFHGNLEPTNIGVEGCETAGGAAYLGSYLDLYEQENPDGTIRVHAGDMVGGSPLISSYFDDEPTIEAMNLMGFDVGTLGNHEFDEGEKLLRNQLNDADFPYVSANVVYADTGELVLDPYTIVEQDGVKIGFIGVTTPETEEIVLADAVAPFDFLDISDSVDRYVPELQAQGVETIVVLAHSGGTQSGKTATGEIFTETRQMSDEVDVVVSGHSHSFL